MKVFELLNEATLPKGVPQFVSKRIMHWDDERRDGNGIMITTALGWAFDPSTSSKVANHVKSFSNPIEAIRGVKLTKECPCDRCKPSARKDDVKKPSDTAKKAAVDRMIKDLGPVKYVGKQQEVTDQDLLDAANDVIRLLKSKSKTYGGNAAEMNGRTAIADVRDWGDWVVPDDVEDDGDYDWKILTQKWSKELDEIEKKAKAGYPELDVNLQTGEKSYIIVQVKRKK